MLNKLLVILSLLFVWTTTIQAQTNYTLQGKVIDQDNNPVLAGNILVLSKEDKSFIKGDAFWDGKFEVNNLSSTNFIVKIVALGYIDQQVEINHTKADKLILAEDIKLELKQLDEVVVSAKKLPVFEQYGDRLVVNLENSSLSNSTSITEILQKTPRVVADQNGNISVFGKGTAAIYVDGQRMQSKDMLNAIAPDDVKQIEIITNPSAKYEASGKAIINIKTKKNKLDGFRSMFLLGFTQRTFLQTYAAASLNYKKDKTNVFLRLSANPNRKEYYEDDYERIFNGTVRLNQGIQKEKKFKHRYFYKIGIDQAITPTSTLGFQYNGSVKKGTEDARNINQVQYNTKNTLNVETLTDTETQSSFNSFNLSYNLNPDSTKQYFNIKADYTLFDYFKNDDIDEYLTSTTQSYLQKRNYGNNNIGILTLQSNYLHPFQSLGIDLETGVKFTNTSNNSNISFDVFQDETPIPVPERSNQYEYKEQVGGAYALLLKDFGKWYIKTGLRVEHTEAEGFSKPLNQKIVDKKYTNFFPSASIRYNISDALDIAVSYSKRIQRPTIQELDPFQFYIDSLTYYQGNPLLDPEITHSSDLTISYMKYASFSTGYSQTRNPMFLFVNQEENNSYVSIASMQNLKKSSKYFASLNLPYQVKFWSTYNVIGFEMNDFDYQVNGVDVELSKPLWYFYFHNDFKLPGDWAIEVNYLYSTAGASGIFEFQPKSNLSFAINKHFFKKSLQVSLSANDILNKDRLRSSTVLDNLQLQYNSFYDNQFLRLNLKYKFGRLKNALYKDKISNREEIRRIKE